MSWHAATRAPFSGALYTFCRRYVMAWSNAEVDIDLNGERWLVEAITKRAPSEDAVFLDVGANVGDWSRLVVDNAPEARLIAFEPVPPVRALLTANLSGSKAEFFPSLCPTRPARSRSIIRPATRISLQSKPSVRMSSRIVR